MIVRLREVVVEQQQQDVGSAREREEKQQQGVGAERERRSSTSALDAADPATSHSGPIDPRSGTMVWKTLVCFLICFVVMFALRGERRPGHFVTTRGA